jgi:hypothetical protein
LKGALIQGLRLRELVAPKTQVASAVARDGQIVGIGRIARILRDQGFEQEYRPILPFCRFLLAALLFQDITLHREGYGLGT